MSQITKDEALDIAKKHINTLIQFKITDQWDDGWGPVYGAEMLIRKMYNCREVRLADLAWAYYRDGVEGGKGGNG